MLHNGSALAFQARGKSSILFICSSAVSMGLQTLINQNDPPIGNWEDLPPEIWSAS